MHYIPTYVYVLFCVLVYLGVRRCFPRTVRPERALVFPLMFVALGASSLNRLFPDASVPAQAAALVAFILGAGLGWLQASRWRLQFHTTDTGFKVLLPGDPSLLVTLLLSFFVDFAQHYALAVHTPWSATHAFEILSFVAWGALAGMPLGRSINVLLRATQAKTRGSASPTLE
ncbi:DUF6622 family protein [Trinickia acidisoli]|uniref:DUF6622 family protein n=1 Tax=Trinickia acidisoli TaxID=2767482 RepID=UPI001A8F9EB5|nr:DUF6622 family protein [Trinickia acidisoli]